MKTISLKLILVVYLAQIVFGGQETTITVKFNESQIVGKIEKSLDGKNVKVFRGIPYAEPPVGDLRFKRPVPLKNVAQSYDAFNWPRSCYQNLSFSPGIDYQNKNLSEDCLYLNIWTPTNASADSPLKAVIVYLHGGNFMVGPSNWTMIGGSVIATKGDVIFININYRLGIFGFLYTGTDDAPGNVGLWDQVLAMEWVRDNIEHFGGDPKRVTLMGSGAGSWSVSLHIYSPISRNLFRNAILQSGAVTNNMFQGLPRDHVKKWLKSVQDIPCHGNQSIQMTDKFNETIIQCLRDADAMTLINITEKMLFNNFGLSGALVVVDGKLIPKKPSDILREGLYNQEINLLFGTSIDEGSFLPAANPKNFTLSEAKQRLEDLISDISQRFEINGKDVSNLYFNGFSDKNTFDELRQTIGKAIADYFISCPTIVFGKEIYRNSNRKANVFQYCFNRKFMNGTRTLNKWFGPIHIEDTIPSHGLPLLEPNKYTETQKSISKQLIQFLTDFAKDGEPTPQSGTKWPKYYTIGEKVITPYFEIIDSPKSSPNFRIGTKFFECNYLWETYFNYY